MSKGAAVLLSLLVLIFTGCDSFTRPSGADRAALVQLESRFGESWEFSFEDVYLRARYRRGGQVPTSEAEEIFRTFWIADGRVRRDSGVVYLNVYDRSNRFSFQLFWDPKDGRVHRGSAEHY